MVFVIFSFPLNCNTPHHKYPCSYVNIIILEKWEKKLYWSSNEHQMCNIDWLIDRFWIFFFLLTHSSIVTSKIPILIIIIVIEICIYNLILGQQKLILLYYIYNKPKYNIKKLNSYISYISYFFFGWIYFSLLFIILLENALSRFFFVWLKSEWSTTTVNTTTCGLLTLFFFYFIDR